MNLVATCPSCGTVFSMVREQLEASSGQVRCGHCMVVFDAKAPAQPITITEDNEIPAPETAESVLPQASLSFVQQAQKQAFWSRKSIVIALTLGSFVLGMILLIQIFRAESERIGQAFPSLKPVVNTLCAGLTCAPLKRLQIEGWRIESSNFQKEGSDTFRLTLQIKNSLGTSLLVPQLELSLLDIGEALLVRRTLPLSGKDESVSGGEERSYSFSITPQADLTAKIIGYRLFLFYP